MHEGPALEDLAHQLASGRTTSRALVEDCLARATDDAGEGARVFTHLDSESARLTADAMDRLRKAGTPLSRYAGIPISIKDLFDIEGQVTRAGSIVLRDAPPASADATAVARLRRAGFVVIGRTNMTEFAYSGLGINPHYGTPRNPWRRDQGHIPGGSSSGAAISVTDGMAHSALGTDTGGSCRIPAAFTGLVGFKPTARRVSLQGALPLSPQLDSIGSIARTVGCCAIMDSVLSDIPMPTSLPRNIDDLRLAVPIGVSLNDLDDEVAAAFDSALHRLLAKGVRIDRIPVPEFDEVAAINSKGGFTAAESYAWHRRLLSAQRDRYDPRVAIRIERGTEQSAADYIDLLTARASLIERATRRIASYHAIVLPTVALTPPRIADLESDEAYGRANLLSLRNCTLINMMDGCAISLPIHKPGEAPVGLMLAASAGDDGHVLSMAALLEPLVAQAGG